MHSPRRSFICAPESPSKTAPSKPSRPNNSAEVTYRLCRWLHSSVEVVMDRSTETHHGRLSADCDVSVNNCWMFKPFLRATCSAKTFRSSVLLLAINAGGSNPSASRTFWCEICQDLDWSAAGWCVLRLFASQESKRRRTEDTPPEQPRSAKHWCSLTSAVD